MLWPETLDYRLYPLSSPGSRLGLSYGGRRVGWAWAGAFCNHFATPIVAPFARIEGAHPPRLTCEPGSCTMTSQALRVQFLFTGENTLRITLDAPTGTRCHFGAIELAPVSPTEVLCRSKAGWAIALCTANHPFAFGHSGITLTTSEPREQIGVGLADEPGAALSRARSALALSDAQAENATRAPWEAIFRRVPDLTEADPALRRLYAECWWTLYNNLVSPRGRLTRRAVYPDRVHHNAVWLWDACFHAVALREADPELARDQLRILLSNQQPDGLVPDVVRDDSLYAEHTKPPLIAWAAWKIHQTEPSAEFLAEIYPGLCGLDAWWMQCRDPNRNGLPGYEHPFSAGIDDCPAFDQLDLSRRDAELEGPDLAAYLYGARLALAKIARALGKKSDAAHWEAQSVQLAQRALALYDEHDDFFYAHMDNRPVRVLIPQWLLAARLLPRDRARRLLERWLVERRCFEDQFLLSTVALDEPSYDPMRWRGGVWLNINLLVAETAAWAGLNEVADHIARRSLELVASRPGVWEHYDASSGEPGGPPSFGMTAAACVEFALGRHRTPTAP